MKIAGVSMGCRRKPTESQPGYVNVQKFKNCKHFAVVNFYEQLFLLKNPMFIKTMRLVFLQ